jgi:hypothetical protein
VVAVVAWRNPQRLTHVLVHDFPVPEQLRRHLRNRRPTPFDQRCDADTGSRAARGAQHGPILAAGAPVVWNNDLATWGIWWLGQFVPL